MSYAAKYVAKTADSANRRRPKNPVRGSAAEGPLDVPLDWFAVDLPDLPKSAQGPLPSPSGGLDYVPYSAVTFLEWGRWWGVWHRDLLPYAERISVRLPFGRWFYDLKRSGRHVWERVNALRMAGFSLFTENPPEWFSLGTMYCMEAQGIG